MRPPLETATDLVRDADLLKARRFGVIEMQDERLKAIHLRPWPKTISVAEIWLGGKWTRRRKRANRCLLYYDQPWGSPAFLALKYIVSDFGTTFTNARGALVILDEIARLKHTDAIVCEVSNLRISDRLLGRWGWERHVLGSKRRHYIKRFYGEYPCVFLTSVCVANH